MRPIIYITLIFAPLVIMVMYGYFSRRQNTSYTGLLLKSYAWGMLAALILIAALILSQYLGLNDLRNLKRSIFFSFVTIGFSAELGKFLITRYLIIPKKQIDRPIDAITFSISVAMGFATIGLLVFLTNIIPIKNLYPYTLLSLIYIPANILFAVILGFFLGMSKFFKNRIIYSICGLFCTTFFHGIFTFCLVTHDFKLLSLFAFGCTVIVFILGLKAAYTRIEAS